MWHWAFLIFLSLGVLALNDTYFNLIAATSDGFGWTVEYTRSIVGEFGAIADAIINYALRTWVLFGGREAIYVTKFSFFENSMHPNSWYIIISGLALFHILCFASFINFAKKSKVLLPVLISLFILVFCIFTVGHMRYLNSYYPIILLGWLHLWSKGTVSSVLKRFAARCSKVFMLHPR